MIEKISLLNQIELLLQKAKQNPSDANVREQLTAVRALCDVVLQSTSATSESMRVSYNDTQSTIVQSGQPLQQRTLPKREDIEQQNDSIFDF